MKALCSFETSATDYIVKPCRFPEEQGPRTHHRDNLKIQNGRLLCQFSMYTTRFGSLFYSRLQVTGCHYYYYYYYHHHHHHHHHHHYLLHGASSFLRSYPVFCESRNSPHLLLLLLLLLTPWIQSPSL